MDELPNGQLPIPTGVEIYKIHKGSKPNCDAPFSYWCMIIASGLNCGVAIGFPMNEAKVYVKTRWNYDNDWSNAQDWMQIPLSVIPTT